MNVAITGSGGFIGSHLSKRLEMFGHRVTPLRRYLFAQEGVDCLAQALAGCHAVINLAGAPIDRRWTDAYKRELVESRIMTTRKPPIRVICPGRVYRADEVDASHSPVFHQMEGLVVDKDVTMADLRGTLNAFAERLYGKGITTRFRPSFFPFTEPSTEVDLTCAACHGKGCRVCKGTGWIEVLGGGMVNPKVLEMCGIDSSVYSGFAFGIGLERIAMQRYSIPDMRLLYEGDLRFLGQFR